MSDEVTLELPAPGVRAPGVRELLKDDAYYTPAPLAVAIVKMVAARLSIHPKLIIEPSAGKGSFVAASRSVWPGSVIIAVEPSAPEQLIGGLASASYVVPAPWELYVAPPNTPNRGADLIIGNPPYSLAESHVQFALSRLQPAGGVLAFLLRLSFLGSFDRLGLWRDSPFRSLVPLVPRPSFAFGGSDSSEYALFVWESGFQGTATVEKPLVWREPGKREPKTPPRAKPRTKRGEQR